MNRGSADGKTAYERAMFASMRPRFMNRGSVDRISGAANTIARFNEAPIHESGK